MNRVDYDDEVFKWLGAGLDPRPPAYLALLGPNRGERGERVLANLSDVAARLRDRPDHWRRFIRSGDWRPTLVGCSAVLLVRETRFLDDLLERFREHSFVAPQLAVALGLVHGAEAVAELERIVQEADSSDNIKGVFSAYAVLKHMGRDAVQEFEASDLFRRARAESPGTSGEAYDCLVAVGVVQSHWEFWTSLDPRPGPAERGSAGPAT